MEKRSRFYLTREANKELWNVRWNGLPEQEENSRKYSWFYADHRKRLLTQLSDLQDKRGLVAAIDRLKLHIKLRTHDFEFRVWVWWMHDSPTLQRVNEVVIQDVGKIGVN